MFGRMILITMILVSTPTEAKRCHTMEAYYAARARHVADSTRHRHHHRNADRVVLPREVHRTERIRVLQPQGPIEFPYATGTSVSNLGRTPVTYFGGINGPID